VKLRPYQQEAVDRVIAEFQSGQQATLLVLPTGTGKTICFGHIANHFSGKTLIVAHLQQLIYQAQEKVGLVMGQRPMIEMGERREVSANCLFGTPPSRVTITSIQTANSGQRCRQCDGSGCIDIVGDMEPRPCQSCLDGLTRRMQAFDPFAMDFLVIDEAHHARTASYERLIGHLRRNPNLKILGATATPRRHDRLGLGKVFGSVAYEYDLLSSINDGWLCPLRQHFVTVKDLNFDEVKMSGGDWSAIDLERLLTQERLLHEHVSPVIDIAGNRAVLFLASGIQHAELACEIFNRHRPKSAICVHSGTPPEQRLSLLDRYHKGEFQYLCGVGCFTEGFDEPRIEVVACARPTRSESLYRQLVGRGLRPISPPTEETSELRRAAIAASSKPDCLVIDFTGNSLTHKLVSTISTADLLSTGLEKSVAERAVCRIRERGGSANMRETMEEIDREDQKRRDEESARRAGVKAKARFHHREIDPFNPSDRSPKHSSRSNRRRRKQLSDKQRAFLERRGIPTGDLSRRKATRIIGEVIKREQEEPCTLPQSRLLLSKGLPGDLTKREASRVISAIADNGWKVPDEIREQYASVDLVPF
jgi:superfamily II DNA or RNA helicase